MASGRPPTDETPSAEPTAEDLLCLDIDLRIGVDGWAQVWEMADWSDQTLAAVIRFAYGCGYLEALSESVRGKLCQDHGFAVPSRRRQK
jgi:hypothetical protein